MSDIPRQDADRDCSSLNMPFAPPSAALINDGAKLHLVPLCACGSEFQKYLHVLVSPLLEELAAAIFGPLQCTHSSHADVAVGVDERCQSKAASTAQYPIGYNVLVTRIFLGDHQANERRAGQLQAGDKVPTSSPGQLHVGSNKPHAAD